MYSTSQKTERYIFVNKDDEEGQELEVTDDTISLFYIQQYFQGSVGLSYNVRRQNMSGTILRACKIEKGGIVHIPPNEYEFKVIYPSKYIWHQN